MRGTPLAPPRSRGTWRPCRPPRPGRSPPPSPSTSTSSTWPRRSIGSRRSGGGPGSRRRRRSASPSARRSPRSGERRHPRPDGRAAAGPQRRAGAHGASDRGQAPHACCRSSSASAPPCRSSTGTISCRTSGPPPPWRSGPRSPRCGSPTGRARHARRSPTRSARVSTSWSTSFWEVLPRVHAELAAAVAEHYPGLTVPRRWLTLASWIGGDRDGNPYVTAAVTAETLRLHRGLAVEQHRRALQDLARRLQRERPAAVRSPPALSAWLAGRRPLPARVAYLERRYGDEPYRLVLALLAADLESRLRRGHDGAAPRDAPHRAHAHVDAIRPARSIWSPPRVPARARRRPAPDRPDARSTTVRPPRGPARPPGGLRAPRRGARRHAPPRLGHERRGFADARTRTGPRTRGAPAPPPAAAGRGLRAVTAARRASAGDVGAVPAPRPRARPCTGPSSSARSSSR